MYHGIRLQCEKKTKAEGFEGTDIAYGNPTSKTLKPAGGILAKLYFVQTAYAHKKQTNVRLFYLSAIEVYEQAPMLR